MEKIVIKEMNNMSFGSILNYIAWFLSALLFIWLLIDFIKVEIERK